MSVSYKTQPVNSIRIKKSSKSFTYQQMHFISVLENIKIYDKICIKIASTCFGIRPSSGSLYMSIAKVTFIKSVKVGGYGLCGYVAACCNMPPHNRTFHNDLLLPI